MTSVFGAGASADVTCARYEAEFAVEPLAYFRIVLTVHAASFAVSGWPSDHFALGCVWKSEEHTSELQSRVDISYAAFCLQKTQRRSDDKAAGLHRYKCVESRRAASP